MTEPRPRPRAFRLDDAGVAFDGRPRRGAEGRGAHRDRADPRQRPSRSTRASARSRSRRPPASRNPGGRRWRRCCGPGSAASSRWASASGSTGSSRACGRKRAASAGLGLAFAALFLAGALGLAARESLALLRQRGVAELHAELAHAHAADDRARARAAVARLIALYETSAGNRRRPRGGPAGDGRDHRRPRSRRDRRARAGQAARRPRPRRSRRRRQAGVAGHRAEPARGARRGVRRRAGGAADAAHRRDLRRPSGPARLHQAGALDRRPSRRHRRHGGRRHRAAGPSRSWHRRENILAHGRGRAQRPAHRPRRPVGALGVPAGAVPRGQAAERQRRRAVPVRRRQ